MNPEIALIGIVSLLILFGLPLVKSRIKVKWLQMVPAPMIVILVAVPVAMWFDLEHEHTYTMNQTTFSVGPEFLVNVKPTPFSMFSEITTPNFSVLASPVAWKWVAMFRTDRDARIDAQR
jgi:MFS superfamily sulfate permease-like transporter